MKGVKEFLQACDGGLVLGEYDLRGSDELYDREFSNIDFRDAWLSGGDLASCIFKGCKFKNTVMERTELVGTSFHDCELNGLQLRDCSVSISFL